MNNDLTSQLLAWFRPQKSNHFFRKQNRNPYITWVSEVALQQTRLDAALPILEAFLKKFPSVESLAEAPIEKVKQAWSGLGYYQRAENLKKGAIYVMENFSGTLPTESTSLKLIPSIGDYTAAAIASLCFNEKVPAIDGNILRVFARMNTVSLPQNSGRLKEGARNFVFEQMRNSNLNPGEINEAFMELGQKICKPQKPLCIQCPMQIICHANTLENPEMFPLRLKKKQTVINLFAKACMIGGKVFLEKNEETPFLKNQWGLPYTIENEGEQCFKEATPLANIFNSIDERIEIKGYSYITKYKIRLIKYI